MHLFWFLNKLVLQPQTGQLVRSGQLGAEISRVLGGGLLYGSLVLLVGPPGIGKSTMLLQIAAMIPEGLDSVQPAPVAYVSGEENCNQIKSRASRMRIQMENIVLYQSSDLEEILENIQICLPSALIVDSIQSVYLRRIDKCAGSPVQIKECTRRLLQFAKETNIPVLLAGHVNKAGDLAGPRTLEHMVDVVLYMDVDKNTARRSLQSMKNRFGATDELGIFKMSQIGLLAVINPTDALLIEQDFGSEILVGLAIVAIVDGSRAFDLKIQALCSVKTTGIFNGVQKTRALMLIKILKSQGNLSLRRNGISVNVVGGKKMKDPAGDLAIAIAISSSFLEIPVPNGFAFVGEIGLCGELIEVPEMKKRMNVLANMGIKKCVVPKSIEKQLTALSNLGGMKILGCVNLKEVIVQVFGRS